MPEVSRFFGITIRMFHNEHGVAHFHAYYGDAAAQVAIDNFETLGGVLPTTAYKLVRQWAAEHQAELQKNWDRAKASQPLVPIAPLE